MDFIDAYVEETNAVPSPRLFRLWSAITAISGALERKVWTSGSAADIFPNLYTLLVGPPASGKSNAIIPIRELWTKLSPFHVSPDNVTKASLIDCLAGALRSELMDDGSMLNFCALNIACGEFGVFFASHDLEFLSILNLMYDPQPIYKEVRRTVEVPEVTKPHLVMLSATQPDFLNTFMPQEAWGMGFASRLIMIYANEAPKVDLFTKTLRKKNKLLPALEEIFKLKGAFAWEDAAKREINIWNQAGAPPAPTHNKLSHYCGRRVLHVLKLSMISAVSRNQALLVTLDDFERAKDWLLEAEELMPDIFRSMSQKSDTQILNDLHYFVYQIWASVPRNIRRPVKESKIYSFLSERVPSFQIAKILETAEKTGMLKRGMYPDEWIPQALQVEGE